MSEWAEIEAGDVLSGGERSRKRAPIVSLTGAAAITGYAEFPPTKNPNELVSLAIIAKLARETADDASLTPGLGADPAGKARRALQHNAFRDSLARPVTGAAHA